MGIISRYIRIACISVFFFLTSVLSWAETQEVTGELRWNDKAFQQTFGNGLTLEVEILKSQLGIQEAVYVTILNKKNPPNHQQVICQELQNTKFTNCIGECEGRESNIHFLVKQLNEAKVGINLKYFLDVIPKSKMIQLEEACEHCNHFQSIETYANCKRTTDSVRSAQGLFKIKDYKLSKSGTKLESVRFIFFPEH